MPGVLIYYESKRIRNQSFLNVKGRYACASQGNPEVNSNTSRSSLLIMNSVQGGSCLNPGSCFL